MASSSPQLKPNPFATPEADQPHVETFTGEFSPGAHNIRMFERQNVWLLILLSIVTLGIYIPFWFHRQARVTDRVLPIKVGDGWIYACYIIFIGAVLWLVPEIIYEDVKEMETVSKALDRVGNLIALVLAFKTRDRIHRVLGATEGMQPWFSGIWTFFLSVLYLQGKINKTQREVAASHPLGGSETP